MRICNSGPHCIAKLSKHDSKKVEILRIGGGFQNHHASTKKKMQNESRQSASRRSTADLEVGWTVKRGNLQAEDLPQKYKDLYRKNISSAAPNFSRSPLSCNLPHHEATILAARKAFHLISVAHKRNRQPLALRERAVHQSPLHNVACNSVPC